MSHIKPKVHNPKGKVAFGQVPNPHGAEITMQPSSSIAIIISIILIKTMILSFYLEETFITPMGIRVPFWLMHSGVQAFSLTDSIMGDVLVQRRQRLLGEACQKSH